MNRIMRALRGRPSTTESTAALWAKSLFGAFLFFVVFMVLLPWGPHHLLPARIPLPPEFGTWGGGALFAVGVGAWIVCLDAFSRRGRGTPAPTDAPRLLVADGLHGVIRNPIIAAELMVIWGEALWFSTLGFIGYAVLMTIYAHWVVVRVEEPELRERFGAAYEAYCRRVPRWVPRFGRSAGATRPRPWWMTALAVFCLATVLFLVPRDLLFGETRDVEVWFGFELRGTAALLTAPVHWAIFGVGAWGFWQSRAWVVPWAAGYVFYVALSHLIWSETSPNGSGWAVGLVQALAISIPGAMLLRARRPASSRGSQA